MNKPFFVPEDFKNLYSGQQDIRETIAMIANKKIKREGKTVYSETENSTFSSDKWRTDEYKAILLCVEPIEKCEHQKEKVKKAYEGRLDEMSFYKCECGAKVEPLTFGEVK